MFRERGREGRGEREGNINMSQKHLTAASRMPPAGDQTHNPGMYPDRELNPRPFGLQDDAPTNRATLARA